MACMPFMLKSVFSVLNKCMNLNMVKSKDER